MLHHALDHVHISFLCHSASASSHYHLFCVGYTMKRMGIPRSDSLICPGLTKGYILWLLTGDGMDMSRKYTSQTSLRLQRMDNGLEVLGQRILTSSKLHPARLRRTHRLLRKENLTLSPEARHLYLKLLRLPRQ